MGVLLVGVRRCFFHNGILRCRREVRFRELLGRAFEEVIAIVNADIIRRSNAGGRLLGYDDQSTAWLVALPSALDIREGDPFRVYLKIPFGCVRHHSLKGFDQNVASWNPRSTQ